MRQGLKRRETEVRWSSLREEESDGGGSKCGGDGDGSSG
jgi:hypothetical protein